MCVCVNDQDARPDQNPVSDRDPFAGHDAASADTDLVANLNQRFSPPGRDDDGLKDTDRIAFTTAKGCKPRPDYDPRAATVHTKQRSPTQMPTSTQFHALRHTPEPIDGCHCRAANFDIIQKNTPKYRNAGNFF